jgi:aminocarboxymuconate-semialdehyde decarboxylase
MSQVIDIHTHMLAEPYIRLLRRHGAPKYTFRTLSRGGEVIDADGAPFFHITAPMFDFDERIRAMNAAGVDVAIVSLTSPNAYLGDAAVSLEAARLMNDAFAEAETAYPGRIRWYASLPWQHPELAVTELARARSAGAVGVMVIANIAGQSLTDPLFEPVWKAIDALALPVLVHPSVPPGGPYLDLVKHNLSTSIGFTFDTSLAIARCLYDGFFDRYARLRIIASHGGGALPFLIGRLDQCFDHIAACAAYAEKRPSDYLERIYVDGVVYDQRALAMCIDVMGEGNVMYGSDYPHNIGDMAGCLARVNALADGARHKVRGDTAERLFGL